VGQGVQVRQVNDRLGLYQAINLLAFLQTHLLASALGNFRQDSPAAIDLDEDAFVIGDQGTDSSLHLVLDGNAGEIVARQRHIIRPNNDFVLAVDRQFGP